MRQLLICFNFQKAFSLAKLRNQFSLFLVSSIQKWRMSEAPFCFKQSHRQLHWCFQKRSFRDLSQPHTFRHLLKTHTHMANHRVLHSPSPSQWLPQLSRPFRWSDPRLSCKPRSRCPLLGAGLWWTPEAKGALLWGGCVSLSSQWAAASLSLLARWSIDQAAWLQ